MLSPNIMSTFVSKFLRKMGPITVQYWGHVICKSESDTVVTSYLMIPTTSSTCACCWAIRLPARIFCISLTAAPLSLMSGGERMGSVSLMLKVMHQSQCRIQITWSASTNQRWRESNVFKWVVEVKSRLPLSCNRGWRWLLENMLSKAGRTI